MNELPNTGELLKTLAFMVKETNRVVVLEDALRLSLATIERLKADHGLGSVNGTIDCIKLALAK